MKLEERCRNVELILSDVDGVFTDGGIIFDNQGIETKRFHVRDGMGVKLWQRAGFKFGILTARTSHVVQLRAIELGIDLIRQGVDAKLPAAKRVMEALGLTPPQVCYIGDDLPDLALIHMVGLGVAVADAAAEVREAAAYVTKLSGGDGAVRETVEFVLRHKGMWEGMIRKYAN